MMDILRAIADKVSETIGLIPDGTNIGEEICIGADGTPTSQIDKIAENTVLLYIQANNVPLNVLSEEIGFVDNGFEETLVLDPIDGTTNSVIGVPLYTISMAVGRKSLLDIHTAYMRNLVTGDEYTAEKGKGAFLNGKRIHVKSKSDPKKLLMMIYLGNGADPKAFELAKRVRTSRAYGCASLEMAYVATGMADGFLMHSENYARSIRVVDIAASILILREAGGEAYDLEGAVLDMPFDLEHRANFLAVGDPKVFDYVMNGDWFQFDDYHRPVYGIYVNMSIPSVEEVAKKVIKALGDEEFILEKEIADALGMNGQSIKEMKVDILITIGGDGTILRALQYSDAMIIGVNAGGVGFLTEIDVKDIDAGIARLLSGDYTVDKRAKIRMKYNGEVMGDAVNEVVIHTDSVAKIRHFRVFINDSLATDLRSDGMLLSTPTGSTCYALSLGAPIIDPRVNAWVMVPMAAFKFSSRPMVIPTSVKVRVENVMDKGCVLVIDGQKEYNLPGGTSVEFERSTKSVRFIRFDTDFYSRIREKLVNVL